ncbi:hypothetical protein QUF58_13125 [Anaerolineales bacterium HSG24]|nr:hypothetical protein [Anaerolineales bacterium HSG24]
MYLPDLSLIRSSPSLPNGVQRLAVGWLEQGQPHSTGEPSTKVLARLTLFKEVNLYFGFHVCDFCGNAAGNGEIHVWGRDPCLFVAPVMIHHYMSEHRYQPPEVFLRAVLEGPSPESKSYEQFNYWYAEGGWEDVDFGLEASPPNYEFPIADTADLYGS